MRAPTPKQQTQPKENRIDADTTKHTLPTAILVGVLMVSDNRSTPLRSRVDCRPGATSDRSSAPHEPMKTTYFRVRNQWASLPSSRALQSSWSRGRCPCDHQPQRPRSSRCQTLCFVFLSVVVKRKKSQMVQLALNRVFAHCTNFAFRFLF